MNVLPGTGSVCGQAIADHHLVRYCKHKNKKIYYTTKMSTRTVQKGNFVNYILCEKRI